MLAFTHRPSLGMQQCARTFVDEQPIDLERANEQHAEYCRLLGELGLTVQVLDLYSELPDCVFIEDTAVVLEEIAILASMGTASRRSEPLGIEPILRHYRDVRRIDQPATLEGGDVLRLGRQLMVGLSSRTNRAGADALVELARPLGYDVLPVGVHGCLHLKTACCALPDGRLLVNPAWLDMASLESFPLVEVPAEETWGANLLLVGEQILLAAEHPRTAIRLEKLGYSVRTVPLSEFAKAEGGATCLSLLIEN
jgi:dimethylargininase